MEKKATQAEELETMELLSGKIEAETPCAEPAELKPGKATDKIEQAVTAAAARAQKKTQK